MNIAHSYVTQLVKGKDNDDGGSVVYLAKSDTFSGNGPQTVVIAGPEAAMLTLLLSGKKLRELSGTEICGLFAQA